MMRHFSFRRLWNTERSRFLLFALLQAILSFIVALLTSVIDPLFLKHTPSGIELLLYRNLMGGRVSDPLLINQELISLLFFAGALILMGGGLIYTGRTDRGRKWTKTFGAFLMTGLLSVLAFPVLSGLVPSFGYSLLYLWRFAGGIFYLMIFWDTASRYFDTRSAKRFYPYLAMTGTLTYAAGSFFGAAGVILRHPWIAFCLIFILSVAGIWLNSVISTRLKPSTAVRYRKNSLFTECTEGVRFFVSHPYLRAMGIATILFGLTSGVVMYSYNGLVTALPAFDTGNGRFMAIQRAFASVAQTAIFALLMKQGKTGRGMVAQILTKFFFLLVGVLGFLVSMLGVADFSRAVSTALMSPVTMSSFALIPSAFRGRAMSLNNMVLAAGGIFLASVLIFMGTLLHWPIELYALIILILLISRIGMNFYLNKGYLKSLEEDLKGKGGSEISDKQLVNALEDSAVLDSWMSGVSRMGEQEKQIIWARMTRFAAKKSHWERLVRWAPEPGSPLEIFWVEICGKCAPVENGDFLRHMASLHSEAGRAAWRHLIEQELLTEEDMKAFIENLGRQSGLWLKDPLAHREEIRFLCGVSPGSLISYFHKVISDSEKEEEMISLLEALKGVPSREMEDFLLENLHSGTIRATLELLEHRKDLPFDCFTEIFNQDQFRNFRTDLIKISFRQDHPDFEKWNNQILKDHLMKLHDSTEESAMSYWFSIRHSGMREPVLYLLRQALVTPSLLKGLDNTVLWALYQRIFSFCSAFFIWAESAGSRDPYPELLQKAFREEYQKAREMALLCLMLARTNSHIRSLIAPSLEGRELELHAVLVLELLESVLSGRELRKIALLLEPLSDARRFIRLKTHIPEMTRSKVIRDWADASREDDSITGVLLKHVCEVYS